MEKSEPEELLIKTAKILGDLSINYFITGGIAVSVWGRPRATFDIDVVVKIIEPAIKPLISAFKRISPAGYIDEDMIKDAIKHEGEFNFIDPKSGLKVDFWVAKKGARASLEFERKRLQKIDDQQIYFTSPEDLILSKLQWYQQSQSNRHLEDIESIFKISGKKLDTKYLKQWAEKLGFLDILNKLAK